LLLRDRSLADAACELALHRLDEPRSQIGWGEVDEESEPCARAARSDAADTRGQSAAELSAAGLPERLRIARGPRATRYYRTVRLAFGGQVVELEKSISQEEFEQLRKTPRCLVQEGRRRVRAPVRELTHGSATLADVPASEEPSTAERARAALTAASATRAPSASGERRRAPPIPRGIAAGMALSALLGVGFAALSIWLAVQSLRQPAADESWYSAVAAPVQYSSH
jgi:hypothetical protein